jgi:hypothetical protein
MISEALDGPGNPQRLSSSPQRRPSPNPQQRPSNNNFQQNQGRRPSVPPSNPSNVVPSRRSAAFNPTIPSDYDGDEVLPLPDDWLERIGANPSRHRPVRPSQNIDPLRHQTLHPPPAPTRRQSRPEPRVVSHASPLARPHSEPILSSKAFLSEKGLRDLIGSLQNKIELLQEHPTLHVVVNAAQSTVVSATRMLDTTEPRNDNESGLRITALTVRVLIFRKFFLET